MTSRPALAHGNRFRFAGVEDVYFEADSSEILPSIVKKCGYQRAYLITSKTLNSTTSAISSIVARLGNRFAGLTDQVGSHAPLENVLNAARLAKAANADVLIAIGGGSVMDLSKVVQLCLTENVFDKNALLELQGRIKPDLSDYLYGSIRRPIIRQIFVPTTMATAEWTAGSTPMNETTKLKARFLVKQGAPETIIYDPKMMSLTPIDLLMSTAIRGLDHAINTCCAYHPHPLATLLASDAVRLFVENLPALKRDTSNLRAMTNCQYATAYTGLGQMSVIHGFSHWMVHIIGPYANVNHSDAACVLMLAQAKWLEGHATEEHQHLLNTLGRSGETLHAVLAELLEALELPTSFEELGISSRQLDEMAPLALKHPLLTKANIRAIHTVQDVKRVLKLGCRS